MKYRRDNFKALFLYSQNESKILSKLIFKSDSLMKNESFMIPKFSFVLMKHLKEPDLSHLVKKKVKFGFWGR
jgi:hypothetical protein